MVLITFMTFVLISSSAVMAMAVGAARAANPKLAVRFLALTIVGGYIPGLPGLRVDAFH